MANPITPHHPFKTPASALSTKKLERPTSLFTPDQLMQIKAGRCMNKLGNAANFVKTLETSNGSVKKASIQTTTEAAPVPMRYINNKG